jgi:hypothetical protein
MIPRFFLLLALATISFAAWAAEDVIAAAREAYRRDHLQELNAAAAKCREEGGTSDYRGLGLLPVCVKKMADGGRLCHGNSECKGSCVIDQGSPDFGRLETRPGAPAVGQCTAEEPHVGWCFVPVENGKAERAVCVD